MHAKYFFNVLIFSLLQFHVAHSEPLKPVSISYENILRCFPELAHNDLSFKVNLDRFKEVMDSKFVTLQSQLRQRKVHFEDPEKQSMILTVLNVYDGNRKTRSELVLQQVSGKGIITDIPLSINQRINPQQDFIDRFMLNGKVKSDESSYVDTKLNEMTSTYRKDFKEVQQISLVDKPKSRSIFCEKHKDMGIICTCTKK